MGTSYARAGPEPEHLVARRYSTPASGETTSGHGSVNSG